MCVCVRSERGRSVCVRSGKGRAKQGTVCVCVCVCVCMCVCTRGCEGGGMAICLGIVCDVGDCLAVTPHWVSIVSKLEEGKTLGIRLI